MLPCCAWHEWQIRVWKGTARIVASFLIACS
jgi:hypothetical protein